jgi:hypothetical protein
MHIRKLGPPAAWLLAVLLVGPALVVAAPAGQEATNAAPTATPGPNATRCVDGAITWADNPASICAERGGIAGQVYAPPP